MSTTQIALIIVQVSLSMVLAGFLTIKLLQTRREKQKYRLYSVRDKLLYLVAVGQLSEDSFIFKVIYKIVNRVIGEVADANRWSFIKASITARHALEEDGTMQRLLDEIRQAPAPTLGVVDEFADAMLDMVSANSPLTVWCIRCLNWARESHQTLSKFVRLLDELIVSRERSQTFYFFARLVDKLHRAHV